MPSYQRLEFLGDAVLDYIVTKLIFVHPKEIPVYRIHRLRSATVNAGFLSYCALSTSIDVTTTSSVPTTTTSTHRIPAFEPITKSLNLPSFLIKAHIPDLTTALAATSHRFTLLQPLLASSLPTDHNKPYPWRALAAFAPEKTVSDLVESVIGACYIDSGGSFGLVGLVARRLGLLQWLENAVEQDVKCWHPKEEIGTFGGKAGVEYVVWRGQGTETDNVDAKVANGDVTDLIDTEPDASGDRTPTQLIFGQGTFHCKVMVNGEHICTSHGWNQLEVETAAAEEAVEILRKRGVVAASTTGTVLEGVEEVEQRDMLVEEFSAMADVDLDETEDQDQEMQEDRGVPVVAAAQKALFLRGGSDAEHVVTTMVGAGYEEQQSTLTEEDLAVRGEEEEPRTLWQRIWGTW